MPQRTLMKIDPGCESTSDMAIATSSVSSHDAAACSDVPQSPTGHIAASSPGWATHLRSANEPMP